MASGSGAGKWRYKVGTDTPIAGAISRIGIPDAKSLRQPGERHYRLPAVHPEVAPLQVLVPPIVERGLRAL